MRDPERITLLLSLIEQIWRHYPDLRFNQLIYNLQHEYSLVNGDDGKVVQSGKDGLQRLAFDLFHVEDDKFRTFLTDYLARL